MKRIILILLLISCVFANAATIIVMDAETSGLSANSEYLGMALTDIIKKEINIFSYLTLNRCYEEEPDYNRVKENVRDYKEKYNAQIITAFKLSSSSSGINLTYYIYDSRWSKKRAEKTVKGTEEKFYVIINKFLSDFYKFTGENRIESSLYEYLNEDSYSPLMGYYRELYDFKQIYSDKQDFSKKKGEACNRFYFIFKDNIYFNIDFYEHLVDSRNVSTTDELMNSLETELGSGHSYLQYLQSERSYNLYRLYNRRDYLNEGIKLSEKAISKLSSRADYHYSLGKLLFLKNDIPQAKMAFEKVVSIDPYNVNACKALIHILWNEGLKENNQNIIEYGERVLEVIRLDRFTLEKITAIYETEGDYKNALKYQKRYLEYINNLLRELNKNKSMHARTIWNLRNKRKSTWNKISYLERMAK